MASFHYVKQLVVYLPPLRCQGMRGLEQIIYAKRCLGKEK